MYIGGKEDYRRFFVFFFAAFFFAMNIKNLNHVLIDLLKKFHNFKNKILFEIYLYYRTKKILIMYF